MTTNFQKLREEKDRAVAFIVARLNSSRLPAKQLRTIGDRSLLTWVMYQLTQCRQLNEIVIATVAEESNEPLRRIAGERGISCFWYEGNVDDVTNRLRLAAEIFEADICVLVSGDCPLVYAPAIDQIICKLKASPDADFAKIRPDEKNNSPALEGVSVARRHAWQLADDLADRPELKEHQFPVIGLRPELFRAIDLTLTDDLYMPHHRLSVDTWADLEFMNTVYENLHRNGKPFELPAVVKLLEEKPELKKINAHVHQRELVEDIKRILFVVDAGKTFGYGHLMRSIELALQIVEYLGWPVTFVIDDEHALSLIEEHGFRVLWGAFARPPETRPSHKNTVRVSEILPDYDLLVLDIFDQRGPEQGWRSKMRTRRPTVVIESLQPWVYEADLIILPNLLGKEKGLNAKPSSGLHDPMYDRPSTRIVGGSEYLILRRSVRQARNGHRKDIDVLVYLHDKGLRNEVAAVTRAHRLNARVLNSFNSSFPDLLARSKLFLSAFGCSFNEALALKTLPICWPDSDAHREDALQFYRELNMHAYVVDSAAKFEDLILPLLRSNCKCPVTVEDGTAGIVKELSQLARAA